MPPVSQAQRAAMHMAAEGKGNLGIPKSVAEEFIASDKPGKLPFHVKRDGGLAGFAAGGLQGGGLAGYPPPAPFFERAEAREINLPNGGFLHSSIAGRTDRIPAGVAPDSFVMPADVVSGLGQGNSLAGGRALSMALKMGPWGTALPAHIRGSGPPRAPAPHVFDSGGKPPSGKTGQAKVLLAGGEFCVPPDVVARIGGGDLKKGHALLRRVVEIVRADTIKRLKKLPPPKRSHGGHVPSLGLAA
jgi:hypothetical protein